MTPLGTARRTDRKAGILERFPVAGLTPRWHTPLNAGFQDPQCAGVCWVIQNIHRLEGHRARPRLDESLADTLDAQWRRITRGSGTQRATPTVDGDRVYVVGGTGVLLCLNAATGAVIWRKDYANDYHMEMPTWGITSSLLIDATRAIAIVGGRPDAKVVAFDKMTGKEIWRALESSSEQGYAQPVIVEAGVPQLIIWHPKAVACESATVRVLGTGIQGQYGHDTGDACVQQAALVGLFLL